MSEFFKGFSSALGGSTVGEGLGSYTGASANSISSGLAGALLGGIQARRNWKYKKKEMALQQKYNLENMQKQFDYQQQAWNAENEYNDPKNAVARWKLAGISPAAVYGSGASGAGVAGSMSTPDSSTPNAGGNVDNSLPMNLASQNMANQTKVTDSQVALNEANARKANAEAEGVEFNNTLQPLFSRIKEAEATSAEAQAKIDTLESNARAAFLEQDMQIKISLVEKYSAEVNKLIKDTELADEQKKVLLQTVDLLKAQTETEGAKKRSLDVDTDIKYASRDSLISEAKERVNNLIKDTNLKDQQARSVLYNRLVDVLGVSFPKDAASGLAQEIIKNRRVDNWLFQRLASEDIERFVLELSDDKGK